MFHRDLKFTRVAKQRILLFANISNYFEPKDFLYLNARRSRIFMLLVIYMKYIRKTRDTYCNKSVGTTVE